MQKFNLLPLAEKCSIVHEHGRFIESCKNDKGDYAIYLMNRAYSFRYAIMFTKIERLGVTDIVVLENWDVSDFLNVSLKNLFIR